MLARDLSHGISSIGFTVYEERHSKLLRILNSIDGTMGNQESATLYKAIGDIIDYARLDLHAEEVAMIEHGYPDFETHKKEHDFFRSNTETYLALMQFGSTPPPSEVVGFLEDWFVTHVIATDKEYSLFLKEKGLN